MQLSGVGHTSASAIHLPDWGTSNGRLMEPRESGLSVIGLIGVVNWTIDRLVKLEYWVKTKGQQRKCARGEHRYLEEVSGTCECCGCPRWTPVRLGQRRRN